MTSVVNICNRALSRLGEDIIQDLNDATVRANQCKRLYNDVRDEVLAAHPWRFALKLSTLSELSAGSDLYSYAYATPSDLLRAFDLVLPEAQIIGSDPIKYEMFGDEIHTDQQDAVLRYVWRITDSAKFDPLFIDALAWKLASELAMPVVGNQQLQASMLQGYYGALSIAKRASASEARKKPAVSTSILSSRGG